ncbi:MAG: hypothetical protein JOZ69_14120 [Myxococcales bacterium]|nr:hypothetical protein [Myxococcales bacterium]
MSFEGGWSGHESWLLGCVASAIAWIVFLIAIGRVHPMLALILGSAWTGLLGGLSAERTLAAFQKGVGETLAGVGLVLALGTMLGTLLAESGGAARLVAVLLEKGGTRRLPWAMAGAAMLVGIPMFFEVGLVLLLPIITAAARRSGTSVIRVGFPALAALSVCHALVPPHPGPLLATAALHAGLGSTLGWGLLVALPTIALAGPIFGDFCAKQLGARLPVLPAVRGPGPRTPAPLVALAQRAYSGEPECANRKLAEDPGPALGREGPGFAAALVTIVLPVALMLLRTAIELATSRAGGPSGLLASLAILGHPTVAMLLSVLAATFTLGRASGWTFRSIGARLGDGLAPIAGMVFIIGAGGGFKQTLIETGVGAALGKAAAGAHAPALLLGWLLSATIRLATGSATVATITASGMLAPLSAMLSPADLPLLALSIGSGSVFFSHVNDAGFWLVKESFGLDLGQTLRSWSVMETIISVVGLASVVAIHAALALAR